MYSKGQQALASLQIPSAYERRLLR